MPVEGTMKDENKTEHPHPSEGEGEGWFICVLNLLINCGGPVLILRIDLLIHIRQPVSDNFYDSLCLPGRGNIEL